jgi:hypothetical protein
VWTDACWRPGHTRPAGIGVVVLLPAYTDNDGVFHDARWFYAEGNCPQALIDKFLVRTQRIGELELLAAVLAYTTFGDLLRDRKLTHWIDNTGALSAMIKGYARAADLARIVFAFAALNLGLTCSPWFEYIASAANIADLPSRGDFELLHELGAVKRELVYPPLAAWDAPPSTWVSLARNTECMRPDSKRSHSTPNGAAPLRSRRRKYATAMARPQHPRVVLAGSAEDYASSASRVIDIDITRTGPFGNPFPMGIFGSNDSRRREVVATYERWLAERTTRADQMRLPDGSPLPITIRPRPRQAANLGIDQIAELRDVCDQAPEDATIRLVCSHACKHRLCHGSVLRDAYRCVAAEPC